MLDDCRLVSDAADRATSLVCTFIPWFVRALEKSYDCCTAQLRVHAPNLAVTSASGYITFRNTKEHEQK